VDAAGLWKTPKGRPFPQPLDALRAPTATTGTAAASPASRFSPQSTNHGVHRNGATSVFPTFWFGFLALFIVLSVVSGAASENPLALVIPVVMAAFGVLLMKKFVWDLVDEVHDHGEFLVVRKGSEEARIPLSTITNVSASTHQRPPRITIRLTESSIFGQEIAFCPITEFTFNPFAKNRIAEELIVRVDQARSRRAV
jgi:hypothetical protein